MPASPLDILCQVAAASPSAPPDRPISAGAATGGVGADGTASMATATAAATATATTVAAASRCSASADRMDVVMGDGDVDDDDAIIGAKGGAHPSASSPAIGVGGLGNRSLPPMSMHSSLLFTQRDSSSVGRSHANSVSPSSSQPPSNHNSMSISTPTLPTLRLFNHSFTSTPAPAPVQTLGQAVKQKDAFNTTQLDVNGQPQLNSLDRLSTSAPCTKPPNQHANPHLQSHLHTNGFNPTSATHFQQQQQQDTQSQMHANSMHSAFFHHHPFPTYIDAPVDALPLAASPPAGSYVPSASPPSQATQAASPYASPGYASSPHHVHLHNRTHQHHHHHHHHHHHALHQHTQSLPAHASTPPLHPHGPYSNTPSHALSQTRAPLHVVHGVHGLTVHQQSHACGSPVTMDQSGGNRTHTWSDPSLCSPESNPVSYGHGMTQAHSHLHGHRNSHDLRSMAAAGAAAWGSTSSSSGADCSTESVRIGQGTLQSSWTARGHSSPSITIPAASRMPVDRLVSGSCDARSAPSHFAVSPFGAAPAGTSMIHSNHAHSLGNNLGHSPPISVVSGRMGGTAATVANGLPPPMPIVQSRKCVHPGMTTYASSAPSGTASPLKSLAARSASKSSGRRDSYTRFTADEEAMLMEGVRVFGVGNWKKILNCYQFHWKRTAVDLKDKYRNMTRAKLRKMNAANAMNESDDSQQQQQQNQQKQQESRSPNSSSNGSPSGMNGSIAKGGIRTGTSTGLTAGSCAPATVSVMTASPVGSWGATTSAPLPPVSGSISSHENGQS